MRRAAALLLLAAALTLTACGAGGKPRHEPPPQARWGKPAGPFAGKHPKAVVMLLHGGGWQGLNERAYAHTLALAPNYQRLGYATLTIDYRRGLTGVDDADRFYRQARRRHPRLPICAVGLSAGGHVALLLAVRHPELACVISLGGVTDLTALAHEEPGELAYKLAKGAFGKDELADLSPTRHAGAIRAKVLLVEAVQDPVVPPEQARLLADRLRGTRVILLPRGDRGAGFVHSRVDEAAAERANLAEARFLAAATRGH